MAENDAATTVGNYFVSNYPPFSFWGAEEVPRVHTLLGEAPGGDAPLGLYVHLPFCRKRCDFCYFKVYTDKNAGEIRRYLAAVLRELEAYATTDRFRGRKPTFVYFGGGTPSYLSTEQLADLFDGMRAIFPWDDAREIAFECEPGTLTEAKIRFLKEAGVTRLSLGAENFDSEILELNNRAHKAPEIYRAYEFARSIGFPQINLDLIAGMVGETEGNWARCVEETAKLAPDAVTIYQMEVPYNTTIYARMKDGREVVAPVADWDTKRRWVEEAFGRLEADGYHASSAYTVCRSKDVEFRYRDALWRGATMLGVGVSSFSHADGLHFQNEPSFATYLDRVEANELPIARAYALDDEERMVREFVLQMKLGRLDRAYFRAKFGVDVAARFGEALAPQERAGFLSIEDDAIVATRAGLLRIDELLHDYFLPRHVSERYV